MKTAILSSLLCFSLLFLASCQKEEAFSPTEEETGAVLRKPCESPTITLTPCDRGFFVRATVNGSPVTLSLNYVIKSGGTTVDSGTVTTGTTTNQVLNNCQFYKVIIEDPCGGKITQSLLSDGCGNVFNC